MSLTINKPCYFANPYCPLPIVRTICKFLKFSESLPARLVCKLFRNSIDDNNLEAVNYLRSLSQTISTIPTNNLRFMDRFKIRMRIRPDALMNQTRDILKNKVKWFIAHFLKKVVLGQEIPNALQGDDGISCRVESGKTSLSLKVSTLGNSLQAKLIENNDRITYLCSHEFKEPSFFVTTPLAPKEYPAEDTQLLKAITSSNPLISWVLIKLILALASEEFFKDLCKHW